MSSKKTIAVSVRDFTARITSEVVPVSLIDPHEQNYNKHPITQIADLAESYKELGQFRSTVLWRRPGGRFTLVAGEGFTTGATQAGATEFRAEVLPEDTPPEFIRRILLADNLHARNSEPDEDILAQLLQEQQEMGFSLSAIGSSEEQLAELLAESDQQESERTRSTTLDEPEGGELEEGFHVLVTCENEGEQQRAYEFLQKEGFTCRVLTL
jgi:ParB-like chromosome segregation protein Spo0J